MTISIVVTGKRKIDMRKIVINNEYGGFGLSDKAWKMYCERTGKDTEKDWVRDVPRDCLALIDIVETLGKESWDDYASLKIVEIPEDVEWEIQEYDGNEWVAEKHRTWA